MNESKTEDIEPSDLQREAARHGARAGLPRRREMTFRLLAIALGTTVALAGVEVASRVVRAGGAADSRREDGSTAPTGSIDLRSLWGASPFFFPSRVAPADLMGTTLPFMEETASRARHNSNGFRTPEYTIARKPDTFRVVVVGDSFTWGQGVAMEETFAYRLTGLIAGAGGLHGREPEVIDLGVCGHRYVDNILKTLIHAQALNPDLVVLQTCYNDIAIIDPWAVSSAWAEVSPSVLARAGRRLSIFAGLEGLRRIDAALKQFDRAYVRESPDWRLAQELFHELESYSRRTNVPVLVLAFPEMGLLGSVTGEPRVEETLRPYRQLLATAAERGLLLLDLGDALRREGEGKDLVVSSSDLHPNAFAHGIAARELADELSHAGILGRPARGAGDGWEAEFTLRRDAAVAWDTFAMSLERRARFHERILELHPTDAWSTFLLADANGRLGRGEESSRLLSRLLELQPRYAAPWHALASLEGQSSRKRQLLEKMLEAVPDHTPSLEDLATLDFAEGRTEEGCRLLRRVAEIPRYGAQLQRALSGLAQQGCPESDPKPDR